MANKTLCGIAIVCLCGGVGADGNVPDPESWYRDAYGPLWADKPAENVEQLLGFYADVVETHATDGEISRSDKTTWLREPMEQWLASGWLSSKLSGLKVDRVNATTAVFKASWQDRYKASPDDVSCGWYLADFQDGAWRFTAYADIECAAHGL